jgi:ParB-like chromosome segregation protein Spo0J
MMKEIAVPIDQIYVPAARRGSVDSKKVEEIAESILEIGQQEAISVRKDAKRGYVLIAGLHRLEACKMLGEKTISAIIAGTPQR